MRTHIFSCRPARLIFSLIFCWYVNFSKTSLSGTLPKIIYLSVSTCLCPGWELWALSLKSYIQKKRKSVQTNMATQPFSRLTVSFFAFSVSLVIGLCILKQSNDRSYCHFLNYKLPSILLFQFPLYVLTSFLWLALPSRLQNRT
jgi:hypothetical protein